VSRRLALGVPRLPLAGAHLAVLTAFAVAQPLFDLLGRNSEFFAARGSTRLDIVAFALGLVVILPAALLAFEALAQIAGARVRLAVHLVLTAVLVGLIALQALRRDGSTPGWVLALLAATIGAGAAFAYGVAPAARSILTVLAPAPLVFLGLFLFDSGATKLALTGEAEAQVANVRASAPVVVVVFDEFLVSVVDHGCRGNAARRSLDSGRPAATKR
jgi:hypothetical protein